MKNLYCWRNS